MKIMMLASEAEPYAKTGGLGDVVSALSRGLAGSGHEVAVVLPLYETTTRVLADRPQRVVSDNVSSRLGDQTRHVRVIRSDEDSVAWFFIDDPEYFGRPGLYGTSDGDYPDNAARFMTLVRGASPSAPIHSSPISCTVTIGRPVLRRPCSRRDKTLSTRRARCRRYSPSTTSATTGCTAGRCSRPSG